MKIYLDNDFKCHLSPEKGSMVIETDFFNGKCSQYVEGYRCIPQGETWTREDGTIFHGEMVAPCEDYAALAEYQAVYEDVQATLKTSYTEGVNSI